LLTSIKSIKICYKGEHLVLTGKSGVGKSTILQAILGFVIPTEGCITVNETELNSKTVWQVRQKIAYVPQEPELGEGSVKDVVYFPFSLKANQEHSVY